MNRTCSLAGCERTFFAKQLCKKHYQRQWEKQPKRCEKTVAQLLVEHRRIDSQTGCWEFVGKLNGRRYGRLAIGGKREQIHRWSAIQYLGFRPASGLNVLHRCDNTLCFNPEHLFIGTQADNVRDMQAKGRAFWQRKR